MKTGTFVKLVMNQQMTAPSGSTAVVVEPTEYTEYYEQLKKLFTDPESLKEFICVRWIEEPTCTQSNGFYLKDRFQIINVERIIN